MPQHIWSIVEVKGVLVLSLSFVVVGGSRRDRFVDFGLGCVV